MRRLSALLISFFLIIPVFISAQQNKDKLNSQLIDERSKALNKEIVELYKMIEAVIADSNILSPDGVKVLPFQTDIIYGPNSDKPEYFELIKHIYIRTGTFSGVPVGYEERTLRLYTDGKTLKKMETTVIVRNFRAQTEEILTFFDPNPGSESKDDIIISHKFNGRKIVEGKKLGEILNNIDLPIQNEIKAEFMIPTLVSLHKNLLFITESNLKSSKDIDANISDSLRKSALY